MYFCVYNVCFFQQVLTSSASFNQTSTRPITYDISFSKTQLLHQLQQDPSNTTAISTRPSNDYCKSIKTHQIIEQLHQDPQKATATSSTTTTTTSTSSTTTTTTSTSSTTHQRILQLHQDLTNISERCFSEISNEQEEPFAEKSCVNTLLDDRY